jgi:hypothetical protein
VIAGLILITAGIVGGGRLADLIPAAALIVCIFLLGMLALIGLVRT